MRMLAIDIGASGGKAVLGEIDGNSLTTTEVRRFPNAFVDIGGHKHWDIVRLFDEVKKCLATTPDVDTFGIDTWGVDYGYVGYDNDLLGLPFAYRDSRTDQMVPYLRNLITTEKLYSITGIQHMPFNTVYQLADDVLNRPWILANARCMLMIPELLGFMMTGVPASEYTNASTTGLIDLKTREWSDTIIDKISFPTDLLLRPVNRPGALKFDMLKSVASETGSRAKLVLTATHDTASAVAAIPARTENWAFISSGTWSLVGMELDEPVVTNDARKANFTNEGGTDGKIRFLRNVTGLWLLEELRRMWKKDGMDISYDEILTEIESAPRFKSLVNPDHPSFVAPDDMRVAIREFCKSTDQTVPNGVGPFARCVFESLALMYRKKIIQLSEITGRSIETIHIVGGGSKNGLLNQMTADACGIPVFAGPSEGTALGNLLVQACSNHDFGSIAYGRRIIANTVEPELFEPSGTDDWLNVTAKFDSLLTD